MKVGITGSHGFIGSHLYSEFKEKSHELSIDACERFDRTRHNLQDINSLKTFVEDKSVIFHLAGVNRVENSDFVKVNTLGTLNLIEAIRKYSSINRLRFIFISALQVYGFTHSLRPLNESYHTQPSNVYGLSKKFAEELIYRYCEDYGLQGIVLRVANVYGPRCKPFYNSVVSTFAYLILKGEPVSIQGSGNSARDFIYVKDVVDGFIKTMNYTGDKPDTFNICTGIPTSINDLVKHLETAVGKEIAVNREGDVPDLFLVGDPSKARKKLGFSYKASLADGLKETLDWFRSEFN